jgi:putative SOS response-associated peptidase YedK
MCGRYTLHTERELLARRFEVDPDALGALEPRYNIAPTSEVLVLRVRDHEREVAHMRWGLVPSWAKDPKELRSMINARVETVSERPAYRSAFRRRRCLVLADGFYEWQKSALERGPKVPHWISLVGGGPFGFAGLWEVWRPEGAPEEVVPLLSCVLLTTAANTDLAAVHDRMPLILPRDREAAWLDPALDDDVEGLMEALTPVPPGSLRACPVSRRVNSVRNDGPGLIEPSDEPSVGFAP